MSNMTASYRSFRAAPLLLCAFALWCLPQPGVAQQSPNARDTRTRLLAKHAMVHEYRQSRDPGLLAEQLYALHLYRQQVPPQEIVTRALAKRRDWTRLRRAALYGDWHANDYGKTATRLIGRAATQWLGAGGIGVELANLAILTYEDALRGERVSRAAQRLTEDVNEWQERMASSEEALFDLVRQTYANDSAFREDVWDVLFLGRYGFRPNSTDQTVLDNYPDFAQHASIREILG